MAFYYQLANIQIFPEDRLNVIIEYWQFAKNIGLEKIAYSLTENIIQTFTPSLKIQNIVCKLLWLIFQIKIILKLLNG